MTAQAERALVIDIRADEEVLQQVAAVGRWMMKRGASPTPGRMPTWEDAVLFCIDACYESLGEI